MTSPLYVALLNSETKESLARMVVALRAELNRRDESGRALKQLIDELGRKARDLSHWTI